MTAAITTRYWDYPFEDCMIRETRTGDRLEVAVKFYGKDESIVEPTHEFYLDVWRGQGTAITADQYEAGKEKPERKVYTPRPPARYWDYPQEQCMIRETHTGTGLDIGIKFYGQRQQRVDETHDLYQQVLHGAGTNISATQYGEGKPQSDGADAT